VYQGIKSRIEKLLDDQVIEQKSLGGSSTGDTYFVRTVSGTQFFVKICENKMMLKAEADGLQEIESSASVRVPKIFALEGQLLILEWIETARPSHPGFWQKFAKALAKLHLKPAKRFGFSENNFCGLSAQKNLPQMENWVEFFLQNRIQFQIDLALQNNLIDYYMLETLEILKERAKAILERTEPEPPVLIHGDLWSGNLLCSKEQEPILIDPAVSYSHREAEFGMMKLFGNFPLLLYEAYEENLPLKSGWQDRVKIYELYHLLNHLNIFGRAYLDSVFQKTSEILAL